MDRVLMILTTFLVSTTILASTDYKQGPVQKVERPDEVILVFSTKEKVTTMGALAASLNRDTLELTTMEAQGKAKVLFSQKEAQGHDTFVLVKQADPQLMSSLLRSQDQVQVYPNYEYIGEMRETDVPTLEDPRIDEQYHHELMGNPQAWSSLELQRPIVVAVTDDGVDLFHEDLKDNIYINPDEIPDNGIDDDNNGYIDDVRGWDFVLDINNPMPGSYNRHGTHVAGIVAAVKGNGVGVAGTAGPAAKIMALRFAGGAGGFTSAMIAETYAYAADNGADIITTSYRIDQFVGDRVVENAIRYVYDQGLIHFNSAGNGAADSPRRKAFEELILVCSTLADDNPMDHDKLSGFSNRGEGIDVCAPGDGGGGILSTYPNNKYGRSSGTSMAAPNAAGVAAMIWAQNPDWTREQVVAQLLGTSDNIDDKNPAYKNKLGSGRVNSSRALSEVMPGPAYTRAKEINNGVVNSSSQSLSLRFNKRLDPATVVPEHFLLIGPEGAVPVELARPYKMGSDYVVLKVPGLLEGTHTLSFDANLTDPFGVPVSGDKSINFQVQ
jgi:hypothetical protein